MTQFMEDWKARTLAETIKPEPNEAKYLRKVLLLVQTSDGHLDAVIEAADCFPGMGERDQLHIDESQTLTTATGRELAKKLFCGSPVATTSSIGVWYCVRCNFETVDPEGTCAGCGGNLEITGRPGEAPSPFMPLPADISLPLLGITGGNTDDAETVPQYIPIWHRLWRNWPVHNIIAHPLHEILYWFGLNRFGEALHDGTVPADSGGR